MLFISSKIAKCNIIRCLLTRKNLQIRSMSKKNMSTAATNDNEEAPIKPPSFAEDDLDNIEAAKINLNKSRLLPQHLRLLNEQRSYDEPQSWIHLTEKYQRKLYGRYGSISGIDPRICFQTKIDVEQQSEYERVAYPFTLKEMIEKTKKEKTGRISKAIKREEDIEKKLAKLEQWKDEVNSKIVKKKADAQIAKERKERLIEEVRRHFGFKIDPKDDRFKEILEQKEKEEKKKEKEAKKKAKDDKIMSKLINMTTKEKENLKPN